MHFPLGNKLVQEQGPLRCPTGTWPKRVSGLCPHPDHVNPQTVGRNSRALLDTGSEACPCTASAGGVLARIPFHELKNHSFVNKGILLPSIKSETTRDKSHRTKLIFLFAWKRIFQWRAHGKIGPAVCELYTLFGSRVPLVLCCAVILFILSCSHL